MRDVGFEAGSVRKGCERQAEIEAEEEFSNATSGSKYIIFSNGEKSYQVPQKL